MKEEALSMDEAKKKLVELEKFISKDPDGMVAKFGRHLVGYLNPQLVPLGFVMACELALHDLQTGVNGFTNKPIQNRLVGYPPIMYNLIRMRIPDIATAILPAEFAAEVKKCIEAIRANAQKAP